MVYKAVVEGKALRTSIEDGYFSKTRNMWRALVRCSFIGSEKRNHILHHR